MILYVAVTCLTFLCLACSTDTLFQRGDPKVREFLLSYFDSWSRRDLTAYQAHFHEKASIGYIESGALSAYPNLDNFVYQQGLAHKAAKGTLTERMTSFSRLHEDENTTVLKVLWELDRSGAKTTGVDLFTLLKGNDGRLRIISLIFYKD